MKKKKGFTLIEVIVVIVILAILMAIAVPSVMSYMNSANKAKYYAASRSVTQKVNVELTKFYAGDSDAKNYNFAVQTAMKSYNKSVTGETYVSAVIFKYVNEDSNPVFATSPYPNNSTPIKNEWTPENIKSITIYYTKSLSSGSFTCYCDVYPNKKIVYHSM